jgi:putative FmdB family regulatory protein
MPLFEYECRTCGHQFEALVLGARKPICPKCKGEDLEKRVSRVGVATSGWGRSSAGCGSSSGGG